MPREVFVRPALFVAGGLGMEVLVLKAHVAWGGLRQLE